MSNAEQWDAGFAAGMTTARARTPLQLKRALAGCRYDTPYCQGFMAGVLHAQRMDA